MYLILVGGMLLLGLGLVALRTSANAHRRTTVARLVTIIEYSTGTVSAASSEASAVIGAAPQTSPVANVAAWLGGLFSGRLTAVREDSIRELLIAAGMYTVSPRTIIGYRVLFMVVLPVLDVLLVGVHSMIDVLMMALALFAGWILPMTMVQRKARLRVDQIDRGLPDLIDLLCVMVEAGLSFSSGMRMAAQQFHGPLGDELRLTLQEQTMGLSIDEALSHMAERADTPAMKAFVRSMGQGEKMGISTGQIMRNLSHEMRHRRRASAEERAQKTPVLMLFPLVFLIFPAMMVILLAPAVINLMHSFKGF
jgi:tight adherence protein C